MLISIDHGNKQIKTVHCPPVVSGLAQSSTRPFGKDVLSYEGMYYTLSDRRIPYKKDKTVDERFYILTLFAIAREIEAQRAYTSDMLFVELAIGLPPAHFGAQNKAFTQYFMDRNVAKFEYHDKPYTVFIEKVMCFPQTFAAAITRLPELIDCPKVLVLDIGGFTADYLLMKNGEADLSNCDSLDNGVILLYNHIRSKANAELDVLLEESDIDAILHGDNSGYDTRIAQLAEKSADQFVSDLFGTLRERMLDPRTGKTLLVGGGAILLRRQIEASGRVGATLFLDDINANAKGYEMLYGMMAGSR